MTDSTCMPEWGVVPALLQACNILSYYMVLHGIGGMSSTGRSGMREQALTPRRALSLTRKAPKPSWHNVPARRLHGETAPASSSWEGRATCGFVPSPVGSRMEELSLLSRCCCPAWEPLSSVESGQEGPQLLVSGREVTKPGHPVAEPCQDPVPPQPSPRAAGPIPGEAGSSCLQPCRGWTQNLP